MAKDLKCDIKMMNQRCKVEETPKVKLPSKEDSVLELASMEERRLALKLERLNLENKSQLKHLARETREVREMMRKQQVLDSAGLSPRGSMDRLNLPPIHSVDSQFRKRSISNPASPRRTRRVNRADRGSAVRRSSTAATPPALGESRGGRSPGAISVNDLGKLAPIMRRTASGQSLQLSVASLDSADSNSDLSDSFNGGSTTPIINVESCDFPPAEDSHRISPRKLERLECPSTSLKLTVELPSASKDSLPPPNSDGTPLTALRQASSDSCLVLPRRKSEVCLDPRFKRLESVLIPGKCQADDENGEPAAGESSPADRRVAPGPAIGKGKKHLGDIQGKNRGSQRPARLVPIRYDSNLTSKDKS